LVNRFIPATARILLFSPTFSFKVLSYAREFAPGAITMTLQHHEFTMENIKQIYMDCSDEDDKYRILVELYHAMCIGSSIIFCQVRFHL
jgi:ATP-dependent RNA helicase DDX19/DBP5